MSSVEAVLLEDAGVLSELGDEGLADAARADRELEMVLRLRAMAQDQNDPDRKPERKCRPAHHASRAARRVGPGAAMRP